MYSPALLVLLLVATCSALTILPAPKPGQCPRFLSLRPCIIRSDAALHPDHGCAFDHQCPGVQKCCPGVCGKVCKNPFPICPPFNAKICHLTSLHCARLGGFAKDRNGCPICRCAKCGPNEQFTQCGGACQPTCNSSIVCLACLPGCSCKPGFIKRTQNGPCIPTSQCPNRQCGLNEQYSQCASPCPPTCTRPTILCRAACRPGCSCKPGFVRRTNNGPCVPTSQCPDRRCGRNEEYTRCGGICQPTCTSSVVCRACKPGCSCKKGFIKRSAKGPCIPTALCPKKRCRRNEVYSRCGGICQPTCASRITCKACRPGCKCRTGYIKSSTNGRCIPVSKCRPPVRRYYRRPRYYRRRVRCITTHRTTGPAGRTHKRRIVRRCLPKPVVAHDE